MTTSFGPPVVSHADVDALPLHRLPKLWLAAAYCYEIETETLIPDSTFDYLSIRLDREWDRVPDQLGHMRVIDRSALHTSSAGYLRDRDYPPYARAYAQRLLKAWHNRVIEYRFLPPGRWAENHAVPKRTAQLSLF